MMDAAQENAATHDQSGIINPSHDIERLTRDIKSLHAMQRELATSDRLERLLKIIPRPGWTTPAEFLLVSSQIQHMADVVQGLEKAQVALLRGAEMVGRR